MGQGNIKSHIFNEIISLENLLLAWQEFKVGKTNKIDVQEFNCKLEENLFTLHFALQAKTYQHSYYTPFFIQDPKLRKIHKATVRDRVLHHAIFRVLYPIFDKTFIADSYSCRIGKGTHRAIRRFNYFAGRASQNNTKTCFVLKCDIKKFFDSIDQKILMDLLAKKIKDQETTWLLEKIIKSYSTKPDISLPLGNITSQLFANIYLNELDQFVKHRLRIKYYLRYCDDFVILSDKKSELENLIPVIGNFLTEQLHLYLHPFKIEIRRYIQGIDFLGYVSFPNHRLLRNKTKKRMFKKIGQKFDDLNQGEITGKTFNQVLQSYLGLLKHCNGHKLEQKILNKISKKYENIN